MKCDAVNALPCIKCSVNICEVCCALISLSNPRLRVLQECRYVPRVREGYNELSRRRPHRDSGAFVRDIRCYCKRCDAQIESSLPPSLSDFCDCDQYMRWICIKCKEEEQTLDSLYLQTKTKWEWEYPSDDVPDEGIWIVSHQDALAVRNLIYETLNPII